MAQEGTGNLRLVAQLPAAVRLLRALWVLASMELAMRKPLENSIPLAETLQSVVLEKLYCSKE
jgi:hypothetical protein